MGRKQRQQKQTIAAPVEGPALTLGTFEVPRFAMVSTVFGARLSEYPLMSMIPEQFQRHSGRFQDVVSSLFFKGGTLEEYGLVLKSGIDRTTAMAAIRAWMCSFDPKHEHKTATVAWALSEWCDDLRAAAGAQP